MKSSSTTVTNSPRFPTLVAKCPWLLLALFSITSHLPAQTETSTGESEDSVVLSPFVVNASEDRGYAAKDTLAGSRLRTSSNSIPQVPITVIRKADAAIIEFSLTNSADKQDNRNKELTDSVDELAAAIKLTPGLRFENREVQLLSGNRSHSIIGKGGSVTSFANFAVFADLSSDTRLYERVKQVRSLVSTAKLIGGTKVIDGPVALYVKRPNETRKELLAKIFEDYEQVKKGLGANLEVLMEGLNRPVQLRACSESEVELWLDYSFSIRSVREMEAKKLAKE